MTIKDYRKKAPVLSNVLLNQVMANCQKKLIRAKDKGGKIAWIATPFPPIFLHAFGIEPFYPQYGVSRHQYTQMSEKLEGKWQVPKDMCSEVKTSLAHALIPSFFHASSTPNLLISSNVVCMQSVNSFDIIGKNKNIPHYFIDMPLIQGNTTPDYENYLAKQFAELIEKIASRFQLRFDEQRFRRGFACMIQCIVIWGEILKLCRRRPSPIDAQDMYPFLFPLMMADMSCGSFESRDMYIALHNELCETIERDVAKRRQPEKHRIYWDSQFIALQKNRMKNALAKYGAAIVMGPAYVLSCPYSRSDESIFHYPLTSKQVDSCYRQSEVLSDYGLDNLDHMAPGKLLAKLFLFMGGMKKNFAWKKNTIKNILSDFRIDAVIMMLLQSCRVHSLLQMQLMEYLDKELHVPVMMIQADGMDARNFSEAQVSVRIEAFLENL